MFRCPCEIVSSGAVLVSTTSKECRDSDADLDVDGDDTLEYGRAQYPFSNTEFYCIFKFMEE